MKRRRQTPLWQIQAGPEFPRSYLFGTMHVRDKRAFYFEEQLLEKMAECDAFAGEINMDEAAEQMAGGQISLQNGSSWLNSLPEKKREKLRAILLKTTGLDIQRFSWLPPEFLISLITEQIFATDMPLSLDAYLWEKAREQGKRILGIEQVEAQLAILQQLEIADQVKSLQSIGKNFPGFRKHTLMLAELYARGDIHEIYRRTRKSIGKYRKLLLFRRNEHMADRIESICREQSTFCAIGAGHLSGQKGVLHLLKSKGFQIKPIPLQIN